MRVLHVLPFAGLGGTEIATRRVADAVRPFGVESAALLLRPTDQLAAYLEQAGMPCITDAGLPEPSLIREAPEFLRQSRRMAHLCAEFDIVHCADVSAAYHLAVAGRMARRPVLCHVRNRELRMPRRNRVFVGAATHFAFVSQETRAGFPMQLPERRTSILYDGVEIPPAARKARADAAAVRAEFDLPRDAVIAAMFARVNPQKDYGTLIRAAVMLRESHPRLRFLIVGDCARVPLNRQHFEQVQAEARAAGVRDRFIFAGYREDTERLMLAADICVLCTHFEGLPLVLIEAMALGRPCVATAVDGIPETLTDGVTGLLHAHGDAAGLAAALGQLADRPDIAEALGARARAEARRRFSRDRFARDVHALYTRLAGRKDACDAEASRPAPASTPAQVGPRPSALPRVSVIVPAYGLAHLLGDALASLQAQSLEDWEAVVVDDGTPDDVAAAFAPFAHDPRIRLLRTDNGGLATARNRAIAQSRAPFVALLDADDQYEPTYLDRMLAAIERDRGLGFVSCDSTLFGPHERGNHRYSQVYPTGGPVTLERVLSRDICIFGAAIIRRTALDEVGGFDGRLRAVEDLDLWIRLLTAGWRGAALSEPLHRYRRHAGSMSSQTRSMLAASCSVYGKAAAALEGRPERAEAERVLHNVEQQLRWVDGEDLILQGQFSAGMHLLADAGRRTPRWGAAVVVLRQAPWLAGLMLRLRAWLPAPRGG